MQKGRSNMDVLIIALIFGTLAILSVFAKAHKNDDQQEG